MEPVLVTPAIMAVQDSCVVGCLGFGVLHSRGDFPRLSVGDHAEHGKRLCSIYCTAAVDTELPSGFAWACGQGLLLSCVYCKGDESVSWI
jgi:hypothetical protein